LLDPARLVFIDETATTTNMVRLRGRCRRGARLIGYAPHGHWKTITFVAGLRHDRMVAPFVMEGAMNGLTFVEWLRQFLVPTFKRRDTVIMDNLPSHKVPGVREAIESASATLCYLPQYSPDLNPIENCFSKIKAHLRKAAERTINRLCRRIGMIATSLSTKECQLFRTHRIWVNLTGMRSRWLDTRGRKRRPFLYLLMTKSPFQNLIKGYKVFAA